MYNHGYISETEYKLALDTELAFQLGGTSVFDGLPFQSAIDYIDWYCDNYLGIDIYKGNMKIYTTFDDKLLGWLFALADKIEIVAPQNIKQLFEQKAKNILN